MKSVEMTSQAREVGRIVGGCCAMAGLLLSTPILADPGLGSLKGLWILFLLGLLVLVVIVVGLVWLLRAATRRPAKANKSVVQPQAAEATESESRE